MKISNDNAYTQTNNVNSSIQKNGEEISRKEVKEEFADTLQTGNRQEKKAGYKVDKEKVNELISQHKSNIAAFQKMVNVAISKQSNSSLVGGIDISTTNGILKLKSMIENGDLKVDAETSKAAQDAIGPNGEWGVEAVSDRIVNFAKAISGGDPKQYDKLKKAIDKGFEEAYGVWGGKEKMPAITQKTYEETMRKMEEWKKSAEAQSQGFASN